MVLWRRFVALQHLLPQPLALIFSVVDQGGDYRRGAIALGVEAALGRRAIGTGLLAIGIPEGEHGVGGAEINRKTTRHGFRGGD